MAERNMATYIALQTENRYNTQGAEAAQSLYRAFFINTAIYARYKLAVDTILNTDGYDECIVTV